MVANIFCEGRDMIRRKIKDAWFKWYWLIGLIAVTITLIIMLRFDYRLTELVVAILTFIFLTHKHKLEETRLFSDLFMSFNERYNKLNDKISDIKSVLSR
jgi:hypothetical protein